MQSDAASTVCDTVPDGFTQVTDDDAGIPNRFAYSLFTSIARSRRAESTSSFRTAGQSHCP